MSFFFVDSPLIGIHRQIQFQLFSSVIEGVERRVGQESDFLDRQAHRSKNKRRRMSMSATVYKRKITYANQTADDLLPCMIEC